MEPVKMLAKEVARSRKAKERILIAKTNLNSMEMQIANSMSMMRVSGAMEKSAELMAIMNQVKCRKIHVCRRAIVSDCPAASGGTRTHVTQPPCRGENTASAREHFTGG
jgi:hypothetical protein